MKKRTLRALLRTAACCTMWLCVSTVTWASPAPSDSVRFCALVDREAWLREHPLPAGKVGAEKNAGEPGTVRMIYFLPNDRPYRQSVVDTMKATMVRLQAWFGEQMASHGYGYMTFRYEADADGAPVVHRVDAEHGDEYYLRETITDVQLDPGYRAFYYQYRVYFVVIDNSTDSIHDRSGRRYLGVSGALRIGGSFFVPAGFSFTTAAHELAHSFGMGWHDFRDHTYILSYFSESRGRLSACSAGYLAVSPYFNAAVPIEDNTDSYPTIEYVGASRWYPPGTRRFTLPWRAADADGVHQVFLMTGNPFDNSLTPEVKACRLPGGPTRAEVSFEYDGVIPSLPNTSFSDPPGHHLVALAVDGLAYKKSAKTGIAEASPHHLATLVPQGYASGTFWSMAFSPDGSVVAAGHVGVGDWTVRVWDVATRREVAALEDTERVVGMAFSPDGGLLAAGSFDETVRLWNVDTWERAGALEGHRSGIAFGGLAYSPAGGILATAWLDSTVKVWDVAARREVATLEWNPRRRNYGAVAFSPDGRILAIGDGDGTVTLWDVDTWEATAALEGGHSVYAVAFSPDGRLLGSAHNDRWIRLWDVAARRLIAARDDQVGSSIAFSPDGRFLAYPRRNRSVALWNVFSEETVEKYAHPGLGSPVAFTPDGNILAIATNYAIELWDVSPHTGPASRIPDWDGDGQVGVGDFVKFAAKYGYTRGQDRYDPRYDLDDDGAVGFGDFLIFTKAFGQGA